MEHPKKRAAEESGAGKPRKFIKLVTAKSSEAEKKGNAAYTAWQQQQPGVGTGFKFSSYVKVWILAVSISNMLKSQKVIKHLRGR